MRTLVLVLLSLILSAINAYAEEIRYTSHIKPLFDRKCLGCHGGDSPEYGDFTKDKDKYASMFKGPRMDSYAHLVHFTGWPDTGSLMRRLDDGKNTKDKKPGNMYEYLGADDEERQKNLKLFREWIGNWMLKRRPEMTKEDLEGIKVSY